MKKEQNSNLGTKVLIYFISIVIGFIATFIVMLIFAFLSVQLDFSESLASPLSSVAAAIGGIVSAFLASRKISSGGILNGVICGGSLFAVIMIISLFLDDGGLTLSSLFHFIILVLSALIGGVWGVNSKDKKLRF